jgi:hypothetical protein
MVVHVFVYNPAVQCAHFLGCMITGKQAFTATHAVIGVVRALEAIQRSIRKGGHEKDVEPY